MHILIKHSMLNFVLLVWVVCLQVADGRFADADDFTRLAAEVAGLKTERHEFDYRITELETKLKMEAAKLSAVEENLAMAETKVAGTEEKLTLIEAKFAETEEKLALTENKLEGADEKLRTTEGKLNDALSRIDELEKTGSWRDEESVPKSKPQDDGDRPSNVTSEADVQRLSKGPTRKYSSEGRAQSKTKRIVPITAPHVAFSVYLQDHLSNLGYQHPLKYDSVILNEGSGFDTVLGVFICPVSGVYVFQSALMARYHDRVQTELVKDGVRLVEIYAGGASSGSGYDQGFNSAITSCNKGEHIWTRIEGTLGTDVYGDSFSSFSGFLLWEL